MQFLYNLHMNATFPSYALCKSSQNNVSLEIRAVPDFIKWCGNRTLIYSKDIFQTLNKLNGTRIWIEIYVKLIKYVKYGIWIQIEMSSKLEKMNIISVGNWKYLIKFCYNMVILVTENHFYKHLIFISIKNLVSY